MRAPNFAPVLALLVFVVAGLDRASADPGDAEDAAIESAIKAGKTS